MTRRGIAAVVAAVAALASAGTARADVAPYRADDYGGFHDILPPGTNGRANGPDIAAFLTAGARPSHNDDQLRMYGDLVYAVPGLKAADLSKYYKDSSFGVPPGDVDRTYNPGGRSDVTIVRDKSFGVPHIYGTTRDGLMFGIGYATAEDRLFFIDVLRHLGRAQLSSFAGGAPGNRAFDRDQWQVAPYTEEDLQQQIQQGLAQYGALGASVQRDAQSYIDGINEYIDEAKLDPTKMPGEYAAIGQPQGADTWKPTDLIATASLVGAIFGKGGGEDLDWATLLQGFQQRFGRRAGQALWNNFLAQNDPEAPTTIHGRRFPYELRPRHLARGSLALPDRGSLTPSKVVESGEDSSGTVSRFSDRPARGGLLSFPNGNSNALLVSARESRSGHPLAVFGPQVAYFAPQILMEEDIHGPGIDARGAAFPGVNLYVELGHGRDYAWSATSAGQDLIDVFAVDLCDPGGGTPTKDSTGYMFRGQCLPIEVLHRTNSWVPNAADQTPPGTTTLVAERTKLGLVIGRATINGRPVAYTRLRSTYFHEVDSAGAFSDFNNPDKIHNARDFQRAAYQIGYTFNWFYVDNRDIAYFNSGNNPVRARNTWPQLPMRARFEWRNYNPDLHTATYTPFSQHPRVINQSYLTSWNNKQAPGFAGSPTNIFNSVYRSQPLEDRIRRGIRGRRKMTLTGLVSAMEDAGTVDLRGDKVLPYALRVLGRQRDPRLASAIAKLRAWQRSGAHRIDRNRDGTYDQSDAIAIMDAWWPRMLEFEFEPTLGQPLFKALEERVPFDNSPNNKGDHLGSAYQDGWYGYAQKDLRQVLRLRVRGRFHRTFCGGGSLRRCRTALATSLRAALDVDRSQEYQDPVCSAAGMSGSQWCYDAVRFRPLGAVTQPLIHWINRPTYQQANEIQGHRPR